jgi:hypothetical protein
MNHVHRQKMSRNQEARRESRMASRLPRGRPSPTGGRSSRDHASSAQVGGGPGGVASPVVTDLSGRSALWARLLAGRVTEVCVLSHRGLYRDLPQTLGLEVIAYEAYWYDSRGVAYTPEERERIAGELAAEPRWLAIGGPRYWVEHFARRAEVILVLMPGDFVSLDMAVDDRVSVAFGSLGRFLKSRLTRRGQEQGQGPMFEATAPTREVTGDRPLTDSERMRYFAQMRVFLIGEFPDKTFVLSSGDARELRSVRALRGR